NKPLYYDRDRIRVESVDQLSLERSTGYGYETDIQKALDAAELRYQQAMGQVEATPKQDTKTILKQLATDVQKIINSQDKQGRWIVHQNKFRKQVTGKRWDGEYRFEDRISSALFNNNVEALCEFLETVKNR
ncbi:MAG: hypothetical protein HOG79_10925, partial [Prolixibacteraceae bacterium]|nr:hypothetical protein [Prolixibacteraceae bacterium]